MAGHSKWANIQHRKKAQDAKRGKLFTKFIREITVAARMGDPDPNANPRLRLAVDNALTANMSKDTIERAIKRGAGAQDGEHYEEIRYEGYGPGGVAVMVDCMTDNRNRTVAEVRHAFTKAGGNLGTSGSVAFMFDRVGQVEYDAKVADADAMLEAAIEAGAEDVVSDENGHQIFTAADDLGEVSKALEAKFGEPRKSALMWKPQNTVAVDDEAGEKILKLIEALDDNDDVQSVTANFEVSDALMAKMSA